MLLNSLSRRRACPPVSEFELRTPEGILGWPTRAPVAMPRILGQACCPTEVLVSLCGICLALGFV